MNGIAIITIQGQEVRLKFGLPAIRHYMEASLTTALTSGEVYSDHGIAVILYAGYKNACLIREEPEKFRLEDFCELVEEDYTLESEGKEAIIAAIKAFNDSRVVKKVSERLKNAKEEEEKKRSTGTTLSPSLSENSVTPQENTID
jgi:hypothetical protein